jgi:hypothetical protein
MRIFAYRGWLEPNIVSNPEICWDADRNLGNSRRRKQMMTSVFLPCIREVTWQKYADDLRLRGAR